MAKHLETGRLGEEIALRLLESKGYIIHERNWVYMHKEVDLIAQEGNDIVFVEVKTRRSVNYGTALQAVDLAKRHNMIVAANSYMRQKGLHLNTRFDIIAIDVKSDGSYSIEHIPGAFYPTAQTIRGGVSRRSNPNRVPKQTRSK